MSCSRMGNQRLLYSSRSIRAEHIVHCRLLPTYTVAAFIKKLSRMALTAPPHGAMLVIELVINLLVRHDTCRNLAHRDTPSDLHSDPYKPDESDMSKCGAMSSSLWEIKVCLTNLAWLLCYM